MKLLATKNTVNKNQPGAYAQREGSEMLHQQPKLVGLIMDEGKLLKTLRSISPPWKTFLLALSVFSFGFEAGATPLKTDAGTPIANITPFPGFTQGGLTFPPGAAFEDGTKVIQYAGPVTQPDAATKTMIINADRAAHPSIPAAGNSDPTPNYDCHGLTFKSGTLWINDDQVDKILTDQKWKLRGQGGVPAAAQVGDIVIYRNPAARTASHPTDVTHSGIVTKVDGSTLLTM